MRTIYAHHYDHLLADVPVDKPHITGLKPYYRMGELLVGNCSSYNSKPAANLTWFVNSNEVSRIRSW